MNRITQKLISFKREETGLVAIVASLLLPVFIILTGMSIDLYRANTLDAMLGYATDAAVIAAVRYDTANINANANKIFYANYPNGYYGVTVTPNVQVSSDQLTVTVSASGHMPTTFGSYIGIHNLPVSGTSVSNKNVQSLELAIVLDVTGSMAWPDSNGVSKISSLQTAVTNLINILYGTDSDGNTNRTRTNTTVSIIPFVAAVNIGTGNQGWLTSGSLPTFASLPTANQTQTPSKELWNGTAVNSGVGGCVFERPAPYDSTDDTPSTSSFDPYFAVSTLPLDATSGYNNGGKSDNDWSAVGLPIITVTVVNPIADGVTGTDFVSLGPNRSCGPPITMPVNDSSTLITAINNLSPVYGGGTTGNVGLVWGWRALSPQWNGLWGSGAKIQGQTTPLPYNSLNNKKVIIYMTDGTNNWNNAMNISTGEPTAYGNVPTNNNNNNLTGNTLGITSSSQGQAAFDAKVNSLCTAIKNAAGSNNTPITIYTIEFNTGGSSNVNATLQNCASTDSNGNPLYTIAETGTDILTAFNNIANQINVINIMQ